MPLMLMTGPRVSIRPMTLDDAHALARAGWIDEETHHLDDGRIPVSPMAYDVMLRRHAEPEPPGVVNLAVVLNETGETIGGIGIRDIDWRHRHAETGSWLFAQEHRGLGLGTEGKMLAMKYAFTVLGLHCLRSDVFAGNPRSAAALAKQGYRLAGRERATTCRFGIWYDTLHFDCLRQDWEQAWKTWELQQGDPGS